MTKRIYDDVTRRTAAALTRRHSFLTLSGVALAAAGATSDAGAASPAGKKANRKCRQQRGECRESVKEACGTSEQCLSDLLPCCEPLATCNAGAATDCFVSFLVN